MNLSTAKRSLLVVITVTLLALVGTSGDSPDPLPADASIANLAAVFASCPFGSDSDAAAYTLSRAEAWLRVERVVEANRDTDESEATPLARVLAQDASSSDISEEEVFVHFSYWPGIDWALVNGGEVWLAVEYRQREKLENYVVYTIFFTADGRAFFPGWCRDGFYTELKGQFGESFEATMRSMVGKTGDELVALVNPANGE